MFRPARSTRQSEDGREIGEGERAAESPVQADSPQIDRGCHGLRRDTREAASRRAAGGMRAGQTARPTHQLEDRLTRFEVTTPSALPEVSVADWK